MSKKMTIAEQLLSIADNPKYNLSDEDKAFLVERADKASRKSNGERKPTAKQVHNAEVADKVYEQMETNRLYTVSEMVKVLPIFAEMDECSASYANAIVKKLKDAGRVTRSVDKGRAYFCKVVG
jgi:hypothetical protein